MAKKITDKQLQVITNLLLKFNRIPEDVLFYVNLTRKKRINKLEELTFDEAKFCINALQARA